jgi:hypothetical protein
MTYNNKAQAAMEFLTTYGWAFLVILLAIAGLSYFGVFDLGRVLPDGCTIEHPKLQCGDVFRLFASGTGQGGEIMMGITNVANQAIVIDQVLIGERSLEAVCDTNDIGSGNEFRPADSSSGWTDTYTINPGQTVELQINILDSERTTCGFETNIGQKKTYDFEMIFTQGNSGINQIAVGSITAVVQ